MLTIVCLRWGAAYKAEYVNVLFRAMRREIEEPFRFVCLSNEPEGFDPGVDVRPIPDMDLPPERWQAGCWPKLSVFKPGLFDDADLVLYFDLDVVILQSLTPFIERARAVGGFHILREWSPALWSLVPIAMRPDRGAQGSLIAWRPKEQVHIYTRFMADPEFAYRTGTDQEYMTEVVTDRHYWPHDWTVSFRRSCIWYYPFNLLFRRIRKPRRARIVIFHGNPRPWDLLGPPGKRWGTKRKFGWGPVDWVVDYWRTGVVNPR